jgi:catechol 2,3-dioxygenase-like lactoylglutathione lyase family enzyme
MGTGGRATGKSLACPPEDIQVISVVPILRMHDVAATNRFYVDYLGCSLDWQDGDGDRPVYLQVLRAALRLHLSSHHDDGTPGTAVLVVVRNLDALHAELHQRGYPFLNPGIGPGPGHSRQMQLIDPASNRIRFYQPAPTG